MVFSQEEVLGLGEIQGMTSDGGSRNWKEVEEVSDEPWRRIYVRRVHRPL